MTLISTYNKDMVPKPSAPFGPPKEPFRDRFWREVGICFWGGLWCLGAILSFWVFLTIIGNIFG
jgi:hypothetical protein